MTGPERKTLEDLMAEDDEDWEEEEEEAESAEEVEMDAGEAEQPVRDAQHMNTASG